MAKKTNPFAVLSIEEKKKAFLAELETNLGNEYKARLTLNLPVTALDEFRKDPAFREREADIYSWLKSELTEESLRVALGRKPSTKDSAHLRWLLAKVDPERYGDKPKEIKHTYSGAVDIRSVDREIELLLGDATEPIEE